jgi:hypothetical protein
MKRLAVLTLFAILFATGAGSQVRFGLRGGINMAYFDAREISVADEYRIETLRNTNIGFHGGLMAQVSFFGIFLQPELLLSSVGNEVRVEDMTQNGLVRSVREQKFTKLDIPVLVGKRFGPVRFGIGPVGTIMLNTDSELSDHPHINEDYNAATFGYQIGAGLDIAFLAIDLKYEGNLTRLGSGITVAGQQREFDTRGRQVIFGVAYLF